jgi:hypothetical protein
MAAGQDSSHSYVFPRDNSLRVIVNPSKQRAQGMPGASTAPAALRADQRKHVSAVTAGWPKTSGIPRAAGFNGFLRALPGDRAFLPPSPARSSPHRLDISVEISEPHDFAVRENAPSSCAQFRVHRIFRPTFSDDRETPLRRAEDARRCARDLPVVTTGAAATQWHDGQIT